ncbi:type II secretion system protein N [Pseudoduganella sp. GCM10020061]|uniref:type II secretion system protein N n=1 Tax=Pseudoduganella sp. GCM10020061 TaxID=3317345 RepID=UPI003628318D
MKRLPLILNVLAVAALSASCAYWALQLYKPEQRPIAAPPPAERPAPSVASAIGLFGGAQVAAVASNYQLTGVVAAGRESVAIIVADGNPAKAVLIGREIVPGVVVQEVHPRYVMLSEGGVAKRIDLVQEARPAPDMAAPVASSAPVQAGTAPQPAVQAATPPPAPPAQQAYVEVTGTVTNAPGPLAPPQGQPAQPYVPPPAFVPQQEQQPPPVRMPPPVQPTTVPTR